MNRPRKKRHILPRNHLPIGEYLKKARLEAKLTQLDVSTALGYSSSQFISNFECGITVPPLKKMRQMVGLYKMNVPELLNLLVETERATILAALTARKSKKSAF